MLTAPEARRRGVARALIEAAAEWAGEAGADAIELWVATGNATARRLYDSAGFRATGDRQPASFPDTIEERMWRPIP